MMRITTESSSHMRSILGGGGRFAVALLSALLLVACGDDDVEPQEKAPCTAGLVDCDGSCVDLEADASHCGGCGTICADGEVCDGGSCVAVCDEGLERCDGECANTETSASHCGGCGVTCDEGELCSQGECVTECAEGEKLCGASCVDASKDTQNCGDCGEVCDEGLVCTDGECGCPEGLKRCGDACVDTDSDMAHCGDCGNPCGDLPNATAWLCDAGACLPTTCDEGFAFCGEDGVLGCETELVTSAAHCGECGNDCGAKPMVESAECSDSTCHVDTCVEGWADCNLDGEDGCETAIVDNVQHCGGCDLSCEGLPNNLAAATCKGSTCALECDGEDWDDCDGNVRNGCETDLRIDHGHCGACNNPCGLDEDCVEGSCVDLQWASWPIPPVRPTAYEVDEEAGTVLDTVTGLMWERSPAQGAMNWEDAQHGCDLLGTGGFNDWRIPSVAELISILDYGAETAPRINTDAFEDAQSLAHWARTPHATNPEDNRWAVNFSNFQVRGTVRVSSSNARLRCVRAGTAPSGPHYDVRDEVVRDNWTGLTWQRDFAGSMPHEDAVAYCAGLELDGKSDWRLPEIRELQSLVNTRATSPAIDTEAFPDTPAEYFWSSTPHAQFPEDTWLVDFELGVNDDWPGTADTFVRCVR